MDLTQAEIERYAPYHTFPEFTMGYDDYRGRRRRANEPGGVGGQAYDRGLECAMRRWVAEFRRQA